MDKELTLSQGYPQVLIVVSCWENYGFVSNSTYPQVLIRLLLILNFNLQELLVKGCEYENKDE